MRFRIAPSASPEDIRRVRAETRALLGLSEATCILVQQLMCGEPGCPPVETVIAVLDGDRGKRTWKLHLPAAEIDAAALRAALDGQTGHRHPTDPKEDDV